MKIKENYIMEGGLGRLWQLTKDTSTFAIIGSQDKDSKIHNPNKLYNLVKDVARNTDGVGYNYIDGSYRYDGGSTGEERSMIVYNISKEVALDIARQLNQETITWKDKDFFGIIRVPNGEVDVKFANNDKNMCFDQETIRKIGGSSALVGKNWKKNKHNSGRPFVFEAYLLQPDKQHYGTCNYFRLCVEKVSENGDCVPVYSVQDALSECNHLDD